MHLIYWDNLKLQYREIGIFPYIGLLVIILLGVFALWLYLPQMINVPIMIDNREDFIKIRNDYYAGTLGLSMVGIIPLILIVIKSWNIRRGHGVGKHYIKVLFVISIVIGVTSKLWIDHLLVDAGYHKCTKHEIHLNLTGRMERKYRPRAWVLDPADCLEP